MAEHDPSRRWLPERADFTCAAEQKAERIRDFVIAHLRLEIRRASDLAEADLLSTAMNTIVHHRTDTAWWVRQGRLGAIAAVHARAERLRAGRR
jgi:hypothetical protein